MATVISVVLMVLVAVEGLVLTVLRAPVILGELPVVDLTAQAAPVLLVTSTPSVVMVVSVTHVAPASSLVPEVFVIQVDRVPRMF